MAKDTAHTAHRTGEPVNRIQVAKDTGHTTLHTQRAHRCTGLRQLKLHGQNHTKCTPFGPCKKIVFHRLFFLKTEY